MKNISGAEIIAVGSELLTPANIDTNSLFLTQRLNDAGYQIHLKTLVGDDQDDIARVLGAALQRSLLIIFTGGLGPTEDDLTRKAVATVLNRSLEINPRVLESLRERFIGRGFKMPPINDRQAEIIAGAEILDNPYGTAPGMWIEEKEVYIVLLPGPPRELKPMFDKLVLPRVQKLGRGRRLAHKSFHIAGMPESSVDSQLAPLYKAYPKVRTTVLATTGFIAVRLHQWLEAGQESTDLEELSAKIQESLGQAIFSTTGQSLEEVVGCQLRESNHTLAVAESCTAGILSSQITRVPGSSDYYLGGVLCYSNEVKMNLCGVSEDLLKKHGAVSAEVAEALAQGVRSSLHSTIGLSITGIAGPGGASPEKPLGLVYIGLSDGEHTLSKNRIIPGDRETIRERSAYFALSWLRRFLMK